MKKEKNSLMHNLVACGGTFDHLHAGHIAFLRFCFSRGEHVFIGITSDAFSKKSKKGNEKTVESFLQRKDNVKQFLRKYGLLKRTTFFTLDDIYGPTILHHPIDALIISDNVQQGGKAVNEKRLQLGLPALPLIIHPMLLAEDGIPISATRIREGLIDRQGKLSIRPEWLAKDRVLTPVARRLCKIPLGDIHKMFTTKNPASTFVVGDVTTNYCNTHEIGYRLAAIDLHVEREKRFESIRELHFSQSARIVQVKNPAGTLTASLFQAVQKAIMDEQTPSTVLHIEGEEDLSVLPIILAVPLGATVVYGQPHEGMVVVVIDEMIKQKAQQIVALCKEK